MHPDYEDITSRIAEAPGWWDEGGVPRYGSFATDRLASIYAKEAVLMEIACQACETVFRVSLVADGRRGESLKERIMEGTLHYGDPPNAGCCRSGATMNSVPARILEYWSKGDPRYVVGTRIVDERYYAWTRNALFEGSYSGWMGSDRPQGEDVLPEEGASDE